jgi:hypothetical protein
MSGQSVCVILCCCQNASIPPEIRSPTQLLRVIDIGSLSTQQRYDNFLECVMDIGCSLDEAVDWKDVMKYCSGYTIGGLRRLLVSCSNQHRLCDGHRFLQTIRGSSLACSDIPIEFPSETLDCLAGFCEFREQLVVNPVVCPVQYRAMGMSHPKGVLLCGPRGSGKTSLVRAADWFSWSSTDNCHPKFLSSSPAILSTNADAAAATALKQSRGSAFLVEFPDAPALPPCPTPRTAGMCAAANALPVRSVKQITCRFHFTT